MENPKLPPILVNKAGSVYYVYTYKNVWDRELKRSKSGESKKIGKILGGQKDGVICFDESFLQERPEFRSFQVERKGKLAVNHVRLDVCTKRLGDFCVQCAFYGCGIYSTALGKISARESKGFGCTVKRKRQR